MRENGNLCSLFENAFVTTDLTGGPSGIRNVVWGCAPDFFLLQKHICGG